MSQDNQQMDLEARNRKVKWRLAGFAAFMIGVAFASVPLYDLYCRVTGYGGTTQEASIAPDEVFDREIKVRFNADIAKDLPWTFEPEVKTIKMKVGESALASYRAVNHSDQPVKGMAVFNVTPLKAGEYFTKIDCFCFVEQTLEAGQEVDMPVTFFVDPEFMEDRQMDDVTTITLSYTFYNHTEDSEADVELSALDNNN